MVQNEKPELQTERTKLKTEVKTTATPQWCRGANPQWCRGVLTGVGASWSILNPTPETLHHTYCTLLMVVTSVLRRSIPNPIRSKTRNPKPETLKTEVPTTADPQHAPTPYTLYPTHYTLYHHTLYQDGGQS